MSRLLDSAFELMDEGRGAQAEAMLLEAVERTRRNHGEASDEHAEALEDASSFFTRLKQLPRAIDLLRRVAALPLSGEEGEKRRLTAGRNIAELLTADGRLDDAEAELRANLEARKAFYGETHAGYAYGLEALAELTWRQGDAATALPLVRQAVDILWDDRNPHVLDVISLRAFIHAAAGAKGGSFVDLPQLADETVDQIADEVLGRASLLDPHEAIGGLLDLIAWLRFLRGDRHPSLIPALARLSDTRRLADDLAGAAEDLQSVIAIAQEAEDIDTAIRAWQGLALLEDAAGNIDAAGATYEEALKQARSFGDPARISQVLRNYGLFLSQQGRDEEAGPILRDAVETARAGRDDDRLGQALVALGIFLQHAENLDEARALLEEAIEHLSPADASVLMARSHLDAIQNRRSCGCGDMDGAIGQTILEMIRPDLPPDLLTGLTYTPEDGVQVQLAREPRPEEMESLTRAIDHAMHRLRQGSSETGYA